MDFLTHATALAALAVIAIQQILKLNIIPLAFANRYPVPTLIVLSIGASAIEVWQKLVQVPVNLGDWILLVSTVVVTAALTYNMTLHNWDGLRDLEGDDKAKYI